ncbi:MAG: AmmeMemoRadiSam system protein B [Candidatus Electronema sp. V4]|uniref:AmmeMemoRadiSam system protein B n=1 Tax=Candidatus Electronema sp. V4 TaxID=3454756 RepID=UPI00405551F2
MSRQPTAAGTFYEADPDKLRKELGRLLPAAQRKKKAPAKVVIVPHGGFIYSGEVAGTTLARVEIPETVVLLGPNHSSGLGAPLAVSGEDWETPLGTVPLAKELATALVKGSKLFKSDNAAHRSDHCLEVQLPFLQHLQKKLRIVPLSISRLPLPQCRQAGMDLAQAIKKCGGPVLLVVSSDMSHNEPRTVTSEKDQLALGDILSLDPANLYRTVLTKRISMCGVIPVTIALFAALELGAERAELIRYTDSGYVSGDAQRVVGYAGLAVR